MRIGIVGSEAAKFTPETERQAREVIRKLIGGLGVYQVVSGECHLGGVDIFAKEEAAALNMEYCGFPPKSLDWSNGYKPRNIQIARFADRVVCITVKTLPAGYTGMRFKSCYHCRSSEHVKSGGCWTVKYARDVLGKVGSEVIVVG